MIEIHVKKNSAIIYAEKIDKITKSQITALLRQDAFADSKIRIMPDTHAGRGAVVGTTMTLSGCVIPAFVGTDIGCGMEAAFLNNKEICFSRLDEIIRSRVPCGSKTHDKPVLDFDLKQLLCYSSINETRALQSIGTLGGGNHFIEIDIDNSGGFILVVHSGSRQLGSDVASYYQEQAYRYQCKRLRKASRLSSYERKNDDEYTCKSAIREYRQGLAVSHESAALDGELFEQYLHDILIVQKFADVNRKTIAESICNAMEFHVTDRFSCVHNYIEAESMIFRKGAISARQNERVIIPLNMRDGAIIGTGIGNPDWNFSAPHGAGRVCSRTDAKYAYSVEEFEKQMTGIYTTTANLSSIDECPMAYKAPEQILSVIGQTVKIEQIIKPVYNFKAC